MNPKTRSTINILIFCTILICLTSCAAPMIAMQGSTSKTFTTSEVDSNKVFSTALRSATEIGLQITSSDKNSGTFHANSHGMMNIIELTFISYSNTSASGSSFTVQAKASSGGDKVIRNFVNTLKKYIPVK